MLSLAVTITFALLTFFYIDPTLISYTLGLIHQSTSPQISSGRVEGGEGKSISKARRLRRSHSRMGACLAGRRPVQQDHSPYIHTFGKSQFLDLE